MNTDRTFYHIRISHSSRLQDKFAHPFSNRNSNVTLQSMLGPISFIPDDIKNAILTSLASDNFAALRNQLETQLFMHASDLMTAEALL